MESQCTTFYLMTLVMFALSATVSRYFESQYALPWSRPLKLVTVKCKYTNWKPTDDIIYAFAIATFFYRSPFIRYSVKICMTLTFRMGQGQIKLHQPEVNRWVPCIGNSNSYAIFHCLWDIQSTRPLLWPLKWAKVRCKHTNRKPVGNFLCWQ